MGEGRGGISYLYLVPERERKEIEEKDSLFIEM